MHNAEAAIEPAFYDHEDENVHARERVAADWGADEVFATVPRRRFRGERRPAASPYAVPAHPRRAATHEHRAEHAYTEVVAAHAVPFEPAPEATGPTDPADAPIESAALTDGVDFEPPTAWAEPPVPGGRRTVTITGRPEGAPPAPRPVVTDRRRPPRTVSDRVGPRPDRVAGWAFGMGILLIVVAAFS
jgi:hypothetical protein